MTKCLLSERLNTLMRSSPSGRLLALRALISSSLDRAIWAASMGLKGLTDQREVSAAIKMLEEPISNSAVILGAVATKSDAANDVIARGCRALVLGFAWVVVRHLFSNPEYWPLVLAALAWAAHISPQAAVFSSEREISHC
jgi:hypothetical protein